MTAQHRVKDKWPLWFVTVLAIAGALIVAAGVYLLFEKGLSATKNVLPLVLAPDREQISVSLFFAAPASEHLVPEERTVAKRDSLVSQVKEVMGELIKGSSAGNVAVLSEKARVREVFIDADGTAFVDLSREVAEDSPGGSWTELAAVYSVVNTLAFNFPEIRRVQILVEGAAVPTLAGHVDTKGALLPRMGLVEKPGETAAQ